MKPLSNDKSRALALKALLADRERGGTVEFWESAVRRDRAAALSDIVDADGWPSADVPSLGWLELELAGLHGASEGWQPHVIHKLSAACEYLWLNARYRDALGLPTVDGPDFVADGGHARVLDTTWAALLYAHSGLWERAAWLGRYVHGYLTSPSLRCVSDEEDREYADLLRLLTRAMAVGAWPAEFPATLGPYQRWLDARLDRAEAEAALHAVLDMRMARYHAYRDVDWPKRQKPSQDSYIMGGFTCNAIPAELWAIRALTQRFDGVELSLTDTHPWLAAPFMAVAPPIHPGFEDEVTRALVAAGNQRFGMGWADGTAWARS